jgi:hypothetical protein
MVVEFRPSETVVATKAIQLAAKIDAVRASMRADLGAVEPESTEDTSVTRKASGGRTRYELT